LASCQTNIILFWQQANQYYLFWQQPNQYCSVLATGKPVLFCFVDRQTSIILFWRPAIQYYSCLLTGNPILFRVAGHQPNKTMFGFDCSKYKAINYVKEKIINTFFIHRLFLGLLLYLMEVIELLKLKT
jgi:hypothetical protein